MTADPSIPATPKNPSSGPLCTGKTKRGPCKRYPTHGSKVCRSHGAGAPQVRAAAARRVAEQRARRGLAQLDVTPIDDPLTELSKLAGQVVAWKDALAAKVNELTGGGCASCAGTDAPPLRYEAMGAGTEQLRAEVALFERALDRCASVLGLIAKLGIDERMARISERQADVVIAAVDAAIVAAGITGTQERQVARHAAARALRAVA